MSRVGKLPVKVPDNIKISINDNVVSFDSGKIKNKYKVSKGVRIAFEDKEIKISAIDNNQPKISMFVGMDRSNINNIVVGMTDGFKTTLEFNGVGYKAAIQGSLLVMDFGYSHEIVYALPEDIKVEVQKPNLIIVSGSNKVQVGQVAAEIISFRKPEPYKGKGVKIAGQQILRKEGKKK